MNKPEHHAQLLWGYESETNTFSPLPTGPWLLPAIIVYTAIVLCKRIIVSPRINQYKNAAGYLSSTKEWQQKYERYNELLSKSIETNQNLLIEDLMEFRRLRKYLREPYR